LGDGNGIAYFVLGNKFFSGSLLLGMSVCSAMLLLLACDNEVFISDASPTAMMQSGG
jgi:hypothetical protein